MTRQTAPAPVGVMEIAARAGVTEIAVRKWVERHRPDSAVPFPAPLPGRVSGRDAWWWHEVVEWLAATGRLVKVTRLDHPDPLVERYIGITANAPGRNWILAEHDDDTAVRSWDGEPEPRGHPWIAADEEELVAEVRQLLLDDWHIH